MLSKKQIKKQFLTLIVVFGLVMVLFLDDSISVIASVTENGDSLLPNPDDYLLPEAKLFIEFVGRLFDLITNDI